MRRWDQLGLDMERHRAVALVGGGGKTSTLYALAREARDAGRRVIVTTTTHMAPHPGLPLTGDPDPAHLRAVLDKYGILVLGRFLRADKLEGAGQLPAFRDAADTVLLEADGARQRPLKAPWEGEPVLPPGLDAVIAAAGMDSVGQAVGAVCHRVEQVCALLGKGPEEAVTPGDVAELLASPRGGRKDVPEELDFRCVLNKADTPARRRAAEEIAARLAARGIQAAITAYLEEERGGLCWF